MPEDWAAVARAISQRVTELDLRQHELAKRAGVSQAIVRELQRNTVQRRRGSRTLEALSTALGWHAQHLTAVLRGQKPPAPGDPRLPADEDDVPARLSVIEHQLRGINDRLDDIRADLTTLLERQGDDR